MSGGGSLKQPKKEHVRRIVDCDRGPIELSAKKHRTGHSTKLKSGGGRLVFAVEEDGSGILWLEEAGRSAVRQREDEPEDGATRVGRK
jgi:hypothetical protein